MRCDVRSFGTPNNWNADGGGGGGINSGVSLEGGGGGVGGLPSSLIVSWAVCLLSLELKNNLPYPGYKKKLLATISENPSKTIFYCRDTFNQVKKNKLQS